MRNQLLYSLLFLASALNAQVIGYNPTSFQSVYEPLDSMESINDKLGGPFYWISPSDEFELSFGFDFPYFDDVYANVLASSTGSYYFPDTEDFCMLLFTGEFMSFAPTFAPPFSEWKYKRDTSEFGKVLILEWQRFGLWQNFLNQIPADSQYLSFRTYFHENGTIDVKMGENLLTDHTYYTVNGEFIDNAGDIYGPVIALADPTAPEDFLYGIGGYYDNPVYLTPENQQFDLVRPLPPVGWTYRFSPKTSNTNQISNPDNIKVWPNPSNGHNITIEHQLANAFVELSDLTGKVVYNGIHTIGKSTILTQNQPSGIYFIKVNTPNGTFIKKIVIQNP
jgi:Secretion system C-terminal sorting domain